MTLYSLRGIAYTRLKNYTAAAVDLDRAMQFGTNDGEVYYCRALCYKMSGENENALPYFDKAVKLGYHE